MAIDVATVRKVARLARIAEFEEAAARDFCWEAERGPGQALSDTEASIGATVTAPSDPPPLDDMKLPSSPPLRTCRG